MANQHAPMMVNDTGLAGKVVIVTGGSSDGEGIGNGKAAAILSARAGASVAVVGRRRDAAQDTVDYIEREGGTACVVTGDVTDEESCKHIVQETVERFGRLDGLDNNVGEGHPGITTNMDMETWRRYHRLNVESQVMMSKYTIPAMVETAGGGSIVNISSMSALRPKGNALIYSSTKGEIIYLSQAMAVDHAKQNIRVNCVIIGPVFTPTVGGEGMSAERRAQRAAASLLGEGNGWDTGYLVRYLLSDQARWMTGQAIAIDGGVSLVGPAR